MKALKTMLSLVLSLALILGMACASAETIADTSLTLRNVVLNINGQEIALPQEARLRLMLDDESAKLGFELARGESVFLPVAGAIDASGARFSLGSSGRVYKLDLSELTELAGFEMDENMPAVNGMVEQYAAVIEGLMNVQKDPEKMAKLMEAAKASMGVMTGSEAVETAVTVNGTEIPAVQYVGGVSGKSAMAGVDALQNTGVEEMDAYFKLMMDIMNASMGTQCTTFTELMGSMGEDMESEEMTAEIMNMDVTMASADGITYEKAIVSVEIEEEAVIEMAAEEILTPEGMDMTLTMTGGEEEYPMDVSFAFHADLAEGKPAAFSGSFGLTTGYDDSDETYVDYERTTLAVDLSGARENELWAGELAMGFESAYGWGDVQDPTESTEAASFSGSYAERAEADGSITSTVDMNMGYSDLAFGLKFDLNAAEGSGLENLFGAGNREYVLTEDDEMVYTLLEGDAAVLSTDAMELSMDESVLAVLEAANSLMGYDMYDDYSEYDDYAYEDAYEDELDVAEPEIIIVYSFDEIGTVFTGKIPTFTPPEGYEFSYADVSASDFHAVYENADYGYVSLYVMDFGFDLGESDEFTYYDDGEGNYYSADAYAGTQYFGLSFDAMDQASAEAVVAGLVL